MKRNIVALFLALTMVITLLAGCGGDSNKESAAPSGTPTKEAAQEGDTTVTNEETSDADKLVASFDEIHVELLGEVSTNSRKPVEDRLTAIWREKTKIIPDIVEIPAGQDIISWLQMQILADTVPAVIGNGNGIATDVQAITMLKSAGMIREIKLEDMKKYMPRTQERLAEYGLTIEDFYNASVDSSDGKMWVLPSLPSPLLNEEYRNSPYGDDQLGNGGYHVWVRDDILKMIYPEAKSAEELKQIAITNGGKLTWEQAKDIPITNMDELYDFLKKIKDLNIQEDGYTITPAHLQFNNSRGAMYWSLMSITGLSLSYDYPMVIKESQNYHQSFETTPEWKTYTSFMNKGFNEGLFGQEFYTQRDEQRDAKIINGEYAVVSLWAPIGANQQRAKEQGKTYGWRFLPIFGNELNPDFQDATNQYLDIKVDWNSKLFNAHKITEEMMPQMLNWMDWNYSTEAAILRAWGTPDMYEGEGMNRRFKPEFKKVEEYLLSGKEDETGDCWYYGLESRFNGTMRNY